MNRFQRLLRCVVWIGLLAMPVAAVDAVVFKPRKDVGVAAVERKTGEVLWEAWELNDLPPGTSDETRTAVKALLANPEQRFREPNFRQRAFQSLTEDQIWTYKYERGTRYYTLTSGTPKRHGAEIARFWTHSPVTSPLVQGGDTLYLLIEGKVNALRARKESKQPSNKIWEPAWTFDMLPELAVERREDLRRRCLKLQSAPHGVWVVHDRGFLQLTPAGKKHAVFEIKNPWQMNWIHLKGGYRMALSFGKRLIYYHHSKGVIALDRETGKEAWRLPTTRSPFLSRVVEVGDDLALVQIGSDVPWTIKGALVGTSHRYSTLHPNTPQQRVAAAMLLKAYGDGYLRGELRRWIAEARKNPDAETQLAADVIAQLIEDWPRKRDRKRLADVCVVALRTGKQKDPEVFASPATQRLLTWSLLEELIYGESSNVYGPYPREAAYQIWPGNLLGLSKDVSAGLAKHCRRVVASGSDEEKGFAASVLLSGAGGFDTLSDDELKKFFLSDHPSVWAWTGMSLIKSGRREQLVSWASKRPERDHLGIVGILCWQFPKTMSTAEQYLWLACARRTPGTVAYRLRLAQFPQSSKIPVVFREPIRTYLEREIADPTVLKNSQKEYDLSAALSLLHGWNNPDDTPLLQKYLTHPCRNKGYRPRDDGEYDLIVTYTVRRVAKNFLEQRGVEVPKNIVYQENWGMANLDE